MHYSPLYTLLFVSILFALIGVSSASEEKEAIKRRMRPLNPYSWQNNRGRRSLDDYLDEDDAISVPGTMMNKRVPYRRNPYAWSRFSTNSDADQSGFFDTLFGGVKDKKSPPFPLNYATGRRVRNPYFGKSTF